MKFVLHLKSPLSEGLETSGLQWGMTLILQGRYRTVKAYAVVYQLDGNTDGGKDRSGNFYKGTYIQNDAKTCRSKKIV